MKAISFILGMEEKIGSLEQGKVADFTILDEDPGSAARWIVRMAGKPWRANDQAGCERWARYSPGHDTMVPG